MKDEPRHSMSTLVRLERLLFARRSRATYASVLVHLLACLALAPWPTASSPRRGPAVALSFVEEQADQQGVEISLADAGGSDRPAETRADIASLEPADTDPLLAAEPSGVPGIAVTVPLLTVGHRPAVLPELPATQTTARMRAALPAASVAGSVGDPAAAAKPATGRSHPAYSSRRGDARGAAVARNGGSAKSEAAVERGLAWLAAHQAGDGSWRFDLSDCRCNGGCSLPGTVTSTTAATGIALLPFLGAGYTHLDGSYHETVGRGLYYLMSRLQLTPRGGDLSEGTMYGHGVATLALAEALGMTGDPMLRPYVRDAVRFIETSQDLHGGGWRYLPGQAGDTTVTAWQVAALKSASLAGLAAPSPTIDGVCRFLDRVQVRGGEGYGYLAPQDRACTSAIGLLCRIYTTWPEEAVLDRGLTRLAKAGPGPEDVYQNFYLSQSLLLRGHPLWKRWNLRNREQLVARQARIGHEAGSWAFADADTRPGGRLGHTALAVLTLEVYYRLLPIYGNEAAEASW